MYGMPRVPSQCVLCAQARHYQAQSELLYKLELTWNLVEILYIDIKPGGNRKTNIIFFTSPF